MLISKKFLKSNKKGRKLDFTPFLPCYKFVFLKKCLKSDYLVVWEFGYLDFKMLDFQKKEMNIKNRFYTKFQKKKKISENPISENDKINSLIRIRMHICNSSTRWIVPVFKSFIPF